MNTQSSANKGVLAEVLAKAYLLKDPNVLTILEPLKGYGIIDILLVTKDYKIKCYDVKFEGLRKLKNKKKTAYLENPYRIYRKLNKRQKDFANKNDVEFGIIYVNPNGDCYIKNYN